MLTVNNLSKSYGVEPVLKNISFIINSNERWGLVGANGCGKSTLLRILGGNESSERGVVRFSPKDLRIGYLPQGLHVDEGDTIDGFLQRSRGDLESWYVRLEELASCLIEKPTDEVLRKDYDNALSHIQSVEGGQDAQILEALGLGGLSPQTFVSILSGGQKTRLAMASVLLTNPQLLLLDEPTNHLDITMLEWLEVWIKSFRGGILLVSHDRIFLDNTVSGILELDAHTHEIRSYAGNYSAYLEQKVSEHEKHRQEYVHQQEEVERLRIAAVAVRDRARYRKGGKTDPTRLDGLGIGYFANRSKEVVQKAKNIERRIDQLLTDERVDKPRQDWQMRIEFGETVSSGRDVLMLENLSVGYGEKVLLSGLNLTLRYGVRAVLTGANGCGKTTLLRTISGHIPPLHGQARLGANVMPGFMTQEQEELDLQQNPLSVIQSVAPYSETRARSFLAFYLFTGDEVFTPLKDLSYGERARLALARLVASGCNFLLLDEPINHLDIPSRTRFEKALTHFEGTILTVLHDRFFIQNFVTQVWEVQDNNIRKKDCLSLR
ncbi:MAG: ABC-F family ATP-binding cassette domain-containing protein [Chloroflexota bacterium]